MSQRHFDPDQTIPFVPRSHALVPHTITPPTAEVTLACQPLRLKAKQFSGSLSDIDIIRQDVQRIVDITPPCGRTRHPVTVICNVLAKLAYSVDPFDPNTILIEGVAFSIEGRKVVLVA